MARIAVKKTLVTKRLDYVLSIYKTVLGLIVSITIGRTYVIT